MAAIYSSRDKRTLVRCSGGGISVCVMLVYTIVMHMALYVIRQLTVCMYIHAAGLWRKQWPRPLGVP